MLTNSIITVQLIFIIKVAVVTAFKIIIILFNLISFFLVVYVL